MDREAAPPREPPAEVKRADAVTRASVPAMLAAVALAAGGSLVADLLLPLGVATGVAYTVAVLISLSLPWPRAPLVVAVTATALMAGVYLLESGRAAGPLDPDVPLNRTLSVFVVWATALLGAMWMRHTVTLREEREKLRMTVDTSLDAIVSIDAAGTIVAANRAAESMFGYARDDLLGHNAAMLMPEPYRGEHDDYIERYLNTGEARIIGKGREVEALHRDGTVFPVHLSVGEMEHPDGIAFTGVIHDLSRRAAAEEEAAAERDFVNAILDASAVIIVVLDRELRVVRWNNACERLFGRTAAQARGRRLPQVLSNSSLGTTTLDRVADEVRQTGHSTNELQCDDADGTRRIIACDHAGIFDEEGALRYMVCIGHDRTEAVGHEKRARELQLELYRVGRLTELGEMASAVAHEMNQPLSSIAGYTAAARRMLGGGADPAELDAVLAKAQQQTERAGDIMRALRRMVGGDEGTRDFADLNEIVQDASRLALVGAPDKGIGVTVSLDRSLPKVHVDTIQVQQVIFNLVRNAVDVLEQASEKRLRIATAASSDSVELVVADTGPGIDPEIAGRLFTPFTSTKPGGMGIGLSLSHSIVQAHGGSIEVLDDARPGATFRVRLPAFEAA